MLLRDAYGQLQSSLFINYYGVRLMRTWLSLAGYIVFSSLTVWAVFILDQHEDTRKFLHPDGANEIVIGATTILLALLVPVAIVLIEDAKKSTLERQAIVKSIIRLGFMPMVLLVICGFLFLPTNIHVFGVSITARTLFAISVLCGLLFILMGFLRSYKWLSDGSTFSSGMPDSPPSEGPAPEAFSSYRFARIVRLLSGAKGYETWFIIWSQWFPEDYEHVLHQAFFKREVDIISGRRTKRFIVMSLELEAYAKYFDKRNKNSWRFELEYIKPFLHLYSLVEARMQTDMKAMKLAGLWRGENALLTINQQLIDRALTGNRIWHCFDAMDSYLIERDLINIHKHGKKDDPLLSYFIEKYFNTLYEDRVSTYHVRPYVAKNSHWQVTYTNLYKKRYNIGFVLANTFQDWLFKKLDEADHEDSNLNLDNVINILFSDADPMIIGELYWFFYNAQHTTDSEEALSAFYTKRRTFGLMGRFYTNWVDDETNMPVDYSNFRHTQQEGAIRLFAIMYQDYFRRFWNLDELISTGQKKIKSHELDDKQEDRLRSILGILKQLKRIYEEPSKK